LRNHIANQPSANPYLTLHDYRVSLAAIPAPQSDAANYKLPRSNGALDRNTLSIGPPPHNDPVKNSSIDLSLPLLLFLRQHSLESRTTKELVFLIKEESSLIRVFDNIRVCVRSVVLRYSSQAVEQIAGINSDKSVDAHIPHVRLMTGDVVSNVAMLFYLLATRAIVKLFANLDGHEPPLSPGDIEVLRM